MKLISEAIVIENEVLTLTNQRCVYWENEKSLILSDLHIGKSAHFRRHGIPIPDNILQSDLKRLKYLIKTFKPQQLLVVGDLFHAGFNLDIKTFKNWFIEFEDVKLILIKGNHDKLSKRVKHDIDMKIVKDYILGPFKFIHDGTDNKTEYFTISGHIHPGVLIKGKGRQRIKLPCYQVTQKQLILPAFSLFTGLNTTNTPPNTISYAFSETGIHKFRQ